jgi:hypothetical protein
MREGVDQVKFFRDNSVNIKNTNGLTESELEEKIIIGKIVERSRNEFVDGLQAINAKFAEEELV